MTMLCCRFEIPGHPRGKGRPRFTADGRAYTPSETRAYEQKVKACYLQQCGCHRFPDDSAIRVWITAVFPVPQSASKAQREKLLSGAHTHKPDADNIAKAILDGLNGVAYRDDARIADLRVRKQYGEAPKVLVDITEIHAF